MSASFKKLFGLEAIDFQSGAFFTDLTVAVEKLRTSRKYSSEDILESGLSSIIKKWTGMTVDVYVKEGVGGFCLVLPVLDYNNPLFPEPVKTFRQNDALKAIEVLGRDLKGTVDRKRSKISGDFEKFNMSLAMDLHLINYNKFSNEEIAAIMLHEIGHGFTFFEFLGYHYKTNMVLSAVTKAFNDTDNMKERKLILKAAEKSLGIDYDDMDRIASSRDVGVVQTITLTESVRKMRSEVGENLYNITMAEQLADEFAARHGAAAALGTATQKYSRLAGDLAARGTMTYLTLEVLKVGAMALLAAGLPGLATYIAIVRWPGQGAHEDPKTRVSKLKNQLLTQLKDKNIPDEKRSQILGDIEVLKDVEGELARRRTFYQFLADTVVPSRRKMRAQSEIHAELEQLASNELFSAAAKYNVGAGNA